MGYKGRTTPIGLSRREYERIQARVRHALRIGKLVKPAHCPQCGTEERFNKAGHSMLHAHHHDYTKPLEVEWLCLTCHKKETPQVRGESVGNARLTVDQVLTILESAEPTCVLARRFGVSETTVYCVRTGRTWRHVRNKASLYRRGGHIAAAIGREALGKGDG